MWLADRMLTGKGEDEEARRRNFWRRLFLGGLGALGGGYLGGSAAWKYKVAPELKQGLGRSMIDPEGAFAAGMAKNWKPNMMRISERLQGQPWQEGVGHGAVEKIDSVLENVARPFDYPIVRDLTPHGTFGFLRPFFGSGGDIQAERFRSGENPFVGELPWFMGESKFQHPDNNGLRRIYHATGLERLAPAIMGAQSSQDPELLEQLQGLVDSHLARLQALSTS